MLEPLHTGCIRCKRLQAAGTFLQLQPTAAHRDIVADVVGVADPPPCGIAPCYMLFFPHLRPAKCILLKLACSPVKHRADDERQMAPRACLHDALSRRITIAIRMM